MKTFTGFLILCHLIMSLSAQDRSLDRQPVVAGSFYPENPGELKNQLKSLFASAHTLDHEKKIRALISPHAGYVFSGHVSASAIGSVSEDSKYENIFIIGSSHRVHFSGASVYSVGNYKTPLGNCNVNTGIANKLIAESKIFTYYPAAHRDEHSIEVQIPFLQYHFGNDISIIPIVIGTQNTSSCKEIANSLQEYFNEKNLFIISSDFSHYPAFNDAKVIDQSTLDALLSGKPKLFLNTLRSNDKKNIKGLSTSMCGWTSGLVLLYLAENDPELEFKHIRYTNSGDTKYGDKSRVVGYHAIALLEDRNETQSETDFSLSHKDQQQLLSIARDNIRSLLYNKKQSSLSEYDPPSSLNENLAAFVTLTIDGKLRGCIGRFISSDPLYKTVHQMSAAAAFQDRRFQPLSKKEFNKTKIEISVLSPLKKIDDIKDIILGKHGVYIKKGSNTGTFLPQVADGKNWTVEDFLGYISRDKAGLGWLGWKNAEIFVYEAFVFEEE